MKELNLQVNVASAVLFLGQGYKFWDAVWAYPENAIDAVEAVISRYSPVNYIPHVWVNLTAERLTIWDNGIGMNPYMHPQAIEQAYRYISGELPNIVNIWEDPKIDVGSRQSLEWTVQCIALSAKLATLSPNIRGEKGTGANAFLRIANRVDVFTKPHPALEQVGYFPPHERGKTYLLNRPTREELEAGHITASIDSYDEPLTDPFGKVLPHGTIVEITGFHEGVLEKLSSRSLERLIAKEAGDQAEYIEIRSTLPTEKNDRKGRWIKVQNTVVYGKPLFLKTLQNKEDNATFQVKLFMDLSGSRKGEVYVTKRGGKKFLLTELERFRSFPWTEIEGAIEFPEYPGIQTWNPTKSALLNTKQRGYWERTLKSIEEVLVIEVQKAKESVTKQIFDGLARQTSDAVREVLSQLSAFAPTTFAGASTSNGLGKKAQSSTTRTHNGRILVTVLNEHHKGYPLAEVELVGKGVSVIRQTGQSGKINFGKNFLPGNYTITLTKLPRNVRLRGNQRVTRSIESSDGDISHVFVVETGTPPPEVRHRSPTFRAFFRAFDDPDQPFKQTLKESGVVEYNIATQAFHDAILNNDEHMKRILIANYTIGALKQYCDEEQIPFDLYEMSVAFGDLVQKLLSQL